MFITEILKFFTTELTVLLTAAFPIIELRGAIPLGVSLGFSPMHSFAISLLGSMLPVPILLFGIRPVFNYLKKTTIFKKTINRLIDRTINKSDRIQRYGFWGLLIFVAVPLPGTGVWSGTLAAALLDMRFKLAFPAILIGNAIAGVLITALTQGAISSFRLL